MSQLKQAYLLKNGEKRIQFVGDPPTKISEVTLLLKPNLEQFKAFPTETYDDEQIAAVSEALEEASQLPEEQKPKIEMYGKYDEFYEVARIFTRVTLPEQFVKKLENVLTEGKISIRGTYKLVHQKYAVAPSTQTSSGTGFIPARPLNRVPLEGEDLHAALQAFFPPPPPIVTARQATWESIDNQSNVFSVEGIQLKEQATYETFNGISKMTEYYKSRGLKYALLSYSVFLEWQDVHMKAEGCEWNVLDKLFQDKPLVDCTIVVSRKKEFPCHRNILAVHSDVLRATLESGMKESKTGRILLNDVCSEAVELMLEFMYCRKLELVGKTGEVVLDLLKVAHKYNVVQLEKLTTLFLSRQPKDWFTMNGALRLYFFTVNVDSLHKLTVKLRSIMKANPQELSSCFTYKAWLKRSPNEASQFAFMLVEPEPTNPPNYLEHQEGAVQNVADDVEIILGQRCLVYLRRCSSSKSLVTI